ncbi:MAG: hypothetical protein MMC23_009550 [Stictis urceolatum]|nr:hypothetical protein [Stictis urceolata]
MGLDSFDGSSKAVKSGSEANPPEPPSRERPVTRSMTGKLLPKKKPKDALLTDDTSEEEPLSMPKKRKARNSETSGQPQAKKSKTMGKVPQKSSRIAALGSRIKERAKTFSIPSRPASKHGGRRNKPQPITCEICLDDKDSLLFSRPYTCAEHDICTACARTYVLGAIESEQATTIKCPSCAEMWSLSTVLLYLNPPEQERYTMAMISTDPKYRKCLAPDCDHGQIHQPGLRKPVVECEKCHAKSCFGHRVPWHEGETCPQYADRLTEERENETEETKKKRLEEEEAETQKHVKNCPACGVTTTKTAGCDAIYCPICRCSWFWHNYEIFMPAHEIDSDFDSDTDFDETDYEDQD